MAGNLEFWTEEELQRLRLSKRPAKRKYIDYDRLYARLKVGPVSFERIREETGLDKKGAYQVVTTLSLKYPVYSPCRGVYALL